jgi:hypothetical protein
MTHPVHRAGLLPALLILAGLSLHAQPLSGSYTINRFLPAGGTNYTSLAAAVNALTFNGVSGPVTFDIYDDGPGTGLPTAFTETSAFAPVNVTWGTNTAVLVLALVASASATNRITFQAAPGEFVQFDATGKSFGVAWNGANYVTLRGIEIFGALFDGITLYNEAAMNGVGPTGNVIEGCRIHDCTGAGIVLYGNVPGPINTTIRNNFLWHLLTNPSGGFLLNARFAYIGSRRCQNTVIEFNTFYVDSMGLPASTGLAVIGSNRGTPSTPFASVRNNLVLRTTGAAFPIYEWKDGVNVPNIPQSMDYNVYDDTSGGAFMRDVGLLYGNLGTFQAANPPREANGRTGQAFLNNPALGDLHIQFASAAVGAADPMAMVAVDIDGEPRPGGCATDAGADEVQEFGPVAAFTVSSASGAAPFTVQFTDTSYSCSGGILAWQWDFQNDGIVDSMMQNPSFTYTCPGIYSVSLSVLDAMGSNGVILNNLINVTPHVFSMSTSGPGPNQYDLTIVPVPSTCPGTASSAQGWTLISISGGAQPVGSGGFFGLVFDLLTLIGLTYPLQLGNPLHFPVTGFTYPDAGPLVAPPGFFLPLAGQTMDAVQVLVDPLYNVLLVSNVARVQF